MRKKLMAILCGLFCLATARAPACSADSPVLIRPTGQFGIGYEDINIINLSVCPDGFYQSNVNEGDFSSNNPRRCHEISVRLYYPTNAKVQLGDLYYAPPISHLTKYYVKTLKLTPKAVSALDSLKAVRTYTTKDAPVSVEKKFPLIVFMPGSGSPAQWYTNIIAELVSHGYMVLGLNSVFANGPVHLANGHLVQPPEQYQDTARLQSLDDLRFVLGNLSQLRCRDQVKQQIDFENVGLLGHSMGAMSIANFVKEKKPFLKGMVLMDPGNVLNQANYPIGLGIIPSMVLWSSQFKVRLSGSVTLAHDSSEIILPSTNHQNFSDLSTLQYHSALETAELKAFLHDTNRMDLGTANGYETSRLINRTILQFFNRYVHSL
jgi:dienelactone hydrolase